MTELKESKSLWPPEVIVIGPGGCKGFLELGALLYLEKEGYLRSVKTYAGVSVGAVISLLIVSRIWNH